MDYGQVESGHLEVVKYLHSIGVDWSIDAMDCASENGHLEVVKYLHSIGAECSEGSDGFCKSIRTFRSC